MPLQFATTHDHFLSLSHSITDECAGAFVTFNGRVRRFNRDREVQFLHYEAHLSLAKDLFHELEEEARGRFNLLKVLAVHRLERVLVGQDAVIISVTSVHRADAFLGARFLIDELKKNIPIWKKEVYLDGSHYYGEQACGCIETAGL